MTRSCGQALQREGVMGAIRSNGGRGVLAEKLYLHAATDGRRIDHRPHACQLWGRYDPREVQWKQRSQSRAS